MIRRAIVFFGLVVSLGVVSSGQTVVTNLESKTGWKSCSECAGTAGQGTFANHWFKQNVTSPALEGVSMQFFLGGTNNYSNAYWWKPVAYGTTATNFVYDFYYYIKNPAAPQALEFEVNQGLNSKKYIFGTQCGFASRVWRVYDAYNHRWVATSIPCSSRTAYKWHHVVLEFHRTSTGKVAVRDHLDQWTKVLPEPRIQPQSQQHQEPECCLPDGRQQIPDRLLDLAR